MSDETRTCAKARWRWSRAATAASVRAIALRLGEEGARIVLGDLDASAEVLEWLAGKGIEAMAVTLDVRDEASWQQAVAQTLERFGSLDVLVNNAGIALPPPDGFEAITLEDWRRVMSVNLDGVFLGMKHAVLAMRERGGSIVNIGSVAAYVGTPGGAAYGASKGALRTLAKQAAVACAKKGYKIRINTVHPMYIWTPLLASVRQVEGGAARHAPLQATRRARRRGLRGAVPGERRGAPGQWRRPGGRWRSTEYMRTT